MCRTVLYILISLLLVDFESVYAQVTIKVHFLYGSTPKHKYKHTESKWFGGKHGGHVGIEFDSNRIVDFVPNGTFHYIAFKTTFHSQFAIHDKESFWEILGGQADSVKKLTVFIPISSTQKIKLDSLVAIYTQHTPYDYAFIGMRCGAAAYDILSKIGILKKYSHWKTYLKIFYPEKLRVRLLKLAQQHKWTIEIQEGSKRRNWERR